MSKRYESDQADDGKSGYREVQLTEQQEENLAINTLLRQGGMPMHLLMDRVGIRGVRMILAVGRLQARGCVEVDSFLMVTIRIKPRLPWYQRLFQVGRIHPALALIAAVACTFAFCFFRLAGT